MRTFIFIILLATAVTAALLWNRRFTTGLEKTAPDRKQQQVEELDRVTILIGSPTSSRHPRPSPHTGRTAPASPRTAPTTPAPIHSPAAAPEPEPIQRTATLRKGETIYALTKRLFGRATRYREILRLNNLSSRDATNLKAGTRLLVPER